MGENSPILYIIIYWTQGKNDNLVLYKDGKLVNQVSCHKLFVIFFQGEGTFTTVLMEKLLKYGISLVFMKRNFRVYACLGAMAEGNYLLRNNQYNFADNLAFSKNLVANKCSNQFTLLKENCPELFQKKSKLKQFQEIQKKIDAVQDLDQLLGIEGNCSKNYFQNYFGKIGWYRRTPRTKVDVPNLLLDLGYTLLFNFVDALLRLHGFDTYKGIYHQLFFQRKSLTCDIMEPFRVIIDKAILKAYNLKKLDEKDFSFQKGQFILKYEHSQKYLQFFLKEIMEHKEDIFRYVKEFYFCILNNKQDYPFFKFPC